MLDVDQDSHLCIGLEHASHSATWLPKDGCGAGRHGHRTCRASGQGMYKGMHIASQGSVFFGTQSLGISVNSRNQASGTGAVTMIRQLRLRLRLMRLGAVTARRSAGHHSNAGHVDGHGHGRHGRGGRYCQAPLVLPFVPIFPDCLCEWVWCGCSHGQEICRASQQRRACRWA